MSQHRGMQALDERVIFSHNPQGPNMVKGRRTTWAKPWLALALAEGRLWLGLAGEHHGLHQGADLSRLTGSVEGPIREATVPIHGSLQEVGALIVSSSNGALARTTHKISPRTCGNSHICRVGSNAWVRSLVEALM